jgi:thiol-disulfide isomerase/thioredoxin
LSKFNKEYLTTALIGYLAYAQNFSNKEELIEIITESEKKIENESFQLSVKNSKEHFLYLNHPFPDNVLDQTMLVSVDSKNKITLRELMQKYSGQPIYFDFWASWCGACRNDIQDSDEAKKLLINKGVIYIYLSLDKDENAWRKASEKDNILSNQFRIIEDNNSLLMQFLKFTTIPQYVYLDKDHKLFSIAAPRPISRFLIDLQTMINASGEKIIYF